MATVTGLTADRMLEIEAESIVDGHVDVATGHLILTRHDTTTIDAGYIVDQSAVVDIATDQPAIDGHKTFLQDLKSIKDIYAESGSVNQVRIGTVGGGAAAGIEFNSALNYIGTISANTFGFATNGVNKMTLDTNGILKLITTAGAADLAAIAVAGGVGIQGRGLALTFDGAAHQGGVTAGLSVAISRALPAVVVNNTAGDSFRTYGTANALTSSITKDGKLSVFGGSIEANNAHLRAIGVGGTPRVYLKATDQGADSKVFDMIPNANKCTIRSLNDAENVAVPLLDLFPSGKIGFPSVASAVAATAGANGALPAQVRGYITVQVNNTDVKIPYYNV